MTLLCAAICSAQEARIVERLSNGEFIIEINGERQRTIKADHAREIVEVRTELERLRRENALLIEQNGKLKIRVELAEKDAKFADAMAKLEQERANKFKAMYDGEHSLRLQSESLARGGRVTKFFDHPITQISLKLAWPGIQTWITNRR